MTVRFVLPLLAALLALSAGPARAAIVNDYSQTDDVWNTPVPVGTTLLDARGGFGGAALQSTSVVYGLAPDAEMGVWLSPGPRGLGAALLGAIDPYVKYRLPITLGPLGFGVVLGAQLPTGPATDATFGVESVMIIGLGPLASLDLGLGVGQDTTQRAALGHANAALYYTLVAGGPTLVGEAFANLSQTTPAAIGQHLGVLFPLGGNVSADLGIGLVETMAGGIQSIPQAGVTLLL